MGLDMYLSRRIYLFDAEQAGVEVKGEGLIHPLKLRAIEEEAMYWRKANAIHNWFVENVQYGADDCGSYEVSIEKLEELYSVVTQVYQDHSKAEELLPVKEGFFFGTYEYDEWYFEAVKYTKESLQEILSEHRARKEIPGAYVYFEYSSSW